MKKKYNHNKKIAEGKMANFWTRGKIVWTIVIAALVVGLGTFGYLMLSGQLKFFAATLPIDRTNTRFIMSPNPYALADGLAKVTITGTIAPKYAAGTAARLTLKGTGTACDLTKITFYQTPITYWDFTVFPPRQRTDKNGTAIDSLGKATWIFSSSQACEVTNVDLTIGLGTDRVIATNLSLTDTSGNVGPLTFLPPLQSASLQYSKISQIPGQVTFIARDTINLLMPGAMGTFTVKSLTGQTLKSYTFTTDAHGVANISTTGLAGNKFSFTLSDYYTGYSQAYRAPNTNPTPLPTVIIQSDLILQ